MRSFTLAFLLGILLFQQLSFLPNLYWAMTLFIFIFLLRWRYVTLLSACAMGFIWSLLYAHFLLSWQLPENSVGKNISINGYIASIPANEKYGTSFLFSLKELQNNSAHGLIKLSWQNENLRVGDQWRLTVRLKKIHGMMNPGGFDYEAWALQEGIHATGRVIDNPDNKLLSSKKYHFFLNRIRQKLKDKIVSNLPVSNTSPWIIALALGERQGISAENWQVLRNTGTNHLMAIAGLHIGFMAGFIFLLVSTLWQCVPRLPLRLPAQHAGAIAALFITFIYSALAGFSIPTQRAAIMLTVFFMMALLQRKILSWQAWSLALLCVLIINPTCVLTENFWLSFGSVALIIYGVSGRLAPAGIWWKLGRMQWVIAFGLIPFSLWLFQQCSIVSFIANSIAIPWVGFLIVPLTLLGCFFLLFSAKLGGVILFSADKLLGVLWIILTYLSKLHWASWYHFMPNNWILLASCIAVVMLLLPVGFSGRYLGMVWLLPLIFYHADKPKSGEMWLTLLDVGQGLSAVVQTKNHILVFDTGPRLSENFDMGESVVAPFLRALDAKKIDMLVISHGDNDHIGGAVALLNYFPIEITKTSVPERLTQFHPSYCLAGQSWQWDGVDFSFLYPAPDKLNLDNDSSCVLRVSNKNHAILLTGDIEKLAETYLHENNATNLSADILIAPHHGSKTSAVDEFLHDVNPHIVLFPVGYQNRYHFPNLSVIEKYHDFGVAEYDTIQKGAIQFATDQGELRFYREDNKRYWHQ